MKKAVIKLLLRIFFLSLPVIAVVGFYICADPFKVIHKYDSYYESGKAQGVTTNRDFVSTETLLKEYPVYKYDSYIIGNSRSLFYEVKSWQKHIHATDCFHFDSYNETLYGIYRKVIYLDKNNMPLKNAIVVMDRQLLPETENSRGSQYIKHYLLSGSGYFPFELEFFKTFINIKFLIAYTDYKVSKKYKPYMKNEFLSDIPVDYNIENNELKFSVYENMIGKNPDDYYLPRKSLFYARDSIPKISPVLIGEKQREMLSEIAAIFKKHNTNYKIIINPLYDQIKLNNADLITLDSIFNKENVFDFSGVNDITNNRYNYYESSHYRPFVADRIMDEIYKDDKKD